MKKAAFLDPTCARAACHIVGSRMDSTERSVNKDAMFTVFDPAPSIFQESEPFPRSQEQPYHFLIVMGLRTTTGFTKVATALGLEGTYIMCWL